MARKDLLKGLMTPVADGDTPAPHPTRVDPARPRYATGAIGAVSESIAALKSRAVVDLDPNLIGAGGLTDRLEHDSDEHARLMASLKEYGQQVPILVRPHPDDADRYQIVYGRRRVLALRDLGLDAKAMIRDLDDRALVMAQGQENTARRDLSFIEKCNFARQMQAADYDRKAICDALNVDKTLISRMLSVADRIPIDVIEAIGAAPSIGRDRWLQFAANYETITVPAEDMVGEINIGATGNASEDRFNAAWDAVNSDTAPKPKQPPKTNPSSSQKVVSENGFEIGKVTRSDDKVTIALPRDGNGGFDDWLADNLTQIHRDWLKRPREE
ncbi:plasmid partitioning protein RepB [Octadecabacter ascidiaceicola]|uniref:Chromosome-partitioning protein ParB n=1 Tax=Octadecabacter ascidiaceicola TaxID=1655543 RepID=A0A238KQV5_9RHOB|nr:plasmid partitioning protein RepB [Octadecabacter ascidiaceicola]SMX45193.1 Chromosome-partitioning protein ParB [Octadecabacter ascidiaceicola]